MKKRSFRFSAKKRQELRQKLAQQRGGTAYERIEPREDRGSFPLSFGQRRLQFLEQLLGSSVLHVVAGAVRLVNPLETEALRRGFAEIARRHEVLRASFPIADGAPVQVIAPPGEVPLPLIDLGGVPVARRWSTAREMAAREARRPFDLERGPLFKVLLLRLEAAEHVLVITLHHIVTDGVSKVLLIRELAALYGAFRQGLASPLQELEIQYADFAAWQDRRLRGDGLERPLAYWRERLRGAPQALDLPADRPRPPARSLAGRQVHGELPSAACYALAAWSRARQGTLFASFLAIFKTLLHRLTSVRDLVVGTPVSGRERREVERLIGFFANTLVLRTAAQGDPPFVEFLDRVTVTVQEALSHQQLPFERLVEELNPERDMSRSPLFQVMFLLEAGVGEDISRLPMPGLEAEILELERGASNYDLTLAVKGTREGMRALVEYSTDLFDGATIHRFLEHFRILLEGVVAAPERRLSELPLRSEAESHQVLREWHGAAPFPEPAAGSARVHEMFAAVAERHPDSVAVVGAEAAMSYGELERRANRLAHELRHLGVGPEEIVALCLERSPDLVIALLATLKAGGAYMPLDPSQPRRRLVRILAEARARVLLTAGELAARPALDAARTVRIDTAAQRLSAWPAMPPDVDLRPENPAYVLFTSGSTGQPKGVVIEHRHLSTYVRGVMERLQLPVAASYAIVSTFAADLGNTSVFGTLCFGGCLHVVATETAADAGSLATYNRRHRLDVLKIVPSHLAAFADSPRFDELLPRKVLMLAGEALSWELVERLTAGAAGCRLINSYGPTETTVGVLASTPEQGADGEVPATAWVPVGRPLPWVRAPIVDVHLRAVALGVAGELALGGTTVARGYLRRPALSAERFVPDPFSPVPGERLYLSGDLVRHLAEGTVSFLRRIDHQVKVRGFRIELGEIEAACTRHPAVRRAVVVERRGAQGDARLDAFVVTDGAPPSPEELRSFLGTWLPAYMVPTAIVPVPEIPLNPNGKVDRAALKRRSLPAESEPEALAPRTPVEEVLSGIWCQLLGRQRIGVHQSFFELGGHSLLAARMITRIRSHLEVEVPLHQVFERPTLAALATYIESERRASEGHEPLAPLVRRDPAVQAPLSFAQERLWFFAQLHPQSELYNVPIAFRLRGELSPGAFHQAIAEIARRHEVLRSRIVLRDGALSQEIAVRRALPVPLVDLAACDPERREAELRRLFAHQARAPFDLSRGPMIRVLLVRLDPLDHAFSVVMDHIVNDGASLRIFGRELEILYRALVARPAAPGWVSPLRELPLQYADYAAWQRRWLASDDVTRELAYWRRTLSGAPPLLELPTDRPRPAVMTFRGASHRLELPQDLADRAKKLGQSHGVTSFITLLTAFEALLHRYTGQRDLVVGTPMANRPWIETEGLIGIFLNMVVLRCDLGGDPSFGELLRRVRRPALDAYAHQNVPFERVVEELQPQRSPAVTPLFQVMFTLQQSASEDRLDLPGLESELLGLETPVARFDLSLSLREVADDFVGAFEFNTDLFDPSTVRHLADHFTNLLSEGLADPDIPLSRLALLRRAERQQLFREWPDTAVSHPWATVHELFEAQAARTPENRALFFEERGWSYRELDRHADRLARRLRRLGVGPEVVVGVSMERSPELVVALLGVLKAGGAYLPLDPAYPPERLRFMIEDARVRLLLTDGEERGKAARIAGRETERLAVEPLDRAGEPAAAGRPADGATAENLAYVIYTSGSSGLPKGVMIRHRNVLPFFAGMDERLDGRQPGTWLAITSISFDISVLEIFWTLSRGATVVLQGESPRAPAPDSPALARRAAPERRMEFSLFYFASAQTAGDHDKYKLVLEGARSADRLGFSAVWTPERHFHDFGGLYPNPATIGAAIAAITEKVEIRAGSIVLPLHHPVRVAEEWSVVDNISGGRVAVSFASGWHADDFVLAPENFSHRWQVMREHIETVRRLWRGEMVSLPGGTGQPVDVALYPRPVQRELPFFITAAGNPETFRLAGELGAGLLTHLLGQSVEELERKIVVYREAWRKAGHEGSGRVALMLHTFLGEDLEAVRELVRRPFCEYLRSSAGLVSNLLRSLGQEGRLEDYTEEEVDVFLGYGFDRYFQTSGLMGTVESCSRMVERLKAIEVDEVACLIDFGVATDKVLESLELLAELRRESDRHRGASPGFSVPEQLVRHRVTHLQSTPSMAKILVSDPAALPGLAGLRKWMIGGEALPASLVRELRAKTSAELHNMYGPTEATIWSATHRFTETSLPDGLDAATTPIAIGREIAGNRIHILDRHLWPVPQRVPGQLSISGEVLASGYLDRPALTAERFLPDPFAGESGGRLYATGDLARRSLDGTLEFLGRVDHQLKLNGYRIEPGEIETVLRQHPAVREATVVPHGKADERRLLAYVVPAEASAPAKQVSAEKERRLLAGQRTFTMPNGMVVAQHDNRQAQGLYDEIFAERVYLRHGINYADGDTIMDVGANTGFFSLFASQMCRPAKIYAFEPIPQNHRILRINTALYGVEAELFECGVAEEPGTADFVFYRHRAGLSGRASSREEDLRELNAFARHGLDQELPDGDRLRFSETEIDEVLAELLQAETHRCRLVTLSQIIAERSIERIDLLKVDVERSEVQVLRGIRDEDWPKIRQVMLEVHSKELLAETRAILEAQGFPAIAVDDLVRIEGPASEEYHVFMVYARRPGADAGRRAQAADAEAVGLSWDDLRAFLRERLPDYMVPALFLPMTALPLTPNGKIDRRALPAPEAARLAARDAYVEPKGEIERRVAAIWQDVLQLGKISRDENFFEAGGSSLLLVRVHQETQSVFERQISLVDFFRHPTIASLAAFLSEGKKETVAVEQSRARRRKQAEVMETSGALDRQRQFLERRRRGRKSKKRKP